MEGLSFKADRTRERLIEVGQARGERSGNYSHGQRSADPQKVHEGINLTVSALLLGLADVLACVTASRY